MSRARAADGTVEALEDPSRRFALGVLWHPEAGEDLALFEALVGEAATLRRRPQSLAPDMPVERLRRDRRARVPDDVPSAG